MVPVGFALVMVFGFMGAFGIRLDATTVLLSSIMIGVGIDYSVHFVWRYRTEIRARRNATDAFFATLTTTGRGIIYNALSVIAGFSVLLASTFQPVSFLGGLVLLSVFSCLYGAFTILPFLLHVLRPGFLLKVEKKEEVPSS
jgi:predicted RND superfamily exporter protein